MERQSKPQQLLCFTFLWSGWQGLKARSGRQLSHQVICLYWERPGEPGAERRLQSNILFFEYPYCRLKYMTLAVLQSLSAHCLQIWTVLTVNNISTGYVCSHHTVAYHTVLILLWVFMSVCLIQSIATSNHFLREVQSHSMGKLFFSFCGDAYTFYDEWNGKSKRKT